jgi:hypothetical protein
VTVTLGNAAITIVNPQFGVSVSRDFAGAVNRILLLVEHATRPFGTIAANGPYVALRHDVMRLWALFSSSHLSRFLALRRTTTVASPNIYVA